MTGKKKPSVGGTGIEFLTLQDFIKRIETTFDKDQLEFSGADLENSNIAILQSMPTEIKAMQDEGDILFSISTPSVDRDGDTINLKGWDLKAYKKNPVVLWAHDYREPPVARALRTFKEDDKLKSLAKFTPEEISPFGYMIYQMIKHKFLNATSVGFKPTDFEFVVEEDSKGNVIRRGIDFKKQELLEYSIVPVPANGEALVEARSMGIKTEYLKDWAEQALDTWEAQADRSGLIVPKDKVEELHKLSDPKGRTQIWFDGLDAKGVHHEDGKDDSDTITIKYSCACEGHEHGSEEEASECIKTVLGIASEFGIEVEGMGKDTFYSISDAKSGGKLILRKEFVVNLTSNGLGTLHDSTYKFDKDDLDAIKEYMIEKLPDTEDEDEDDFQIKESEVASSLSWDVSHKEGVKAAPIDTEWQRELQIFGATDESLKVMSAYMDTTKDVDGKDKACYKLVHHQASESNPVVWCGVVEAMGSLLGINGGVDIAPSNRKEVYDHLALHYKKDFNKEPPEFRYVEAQVLAHLPDVYALDLDSGGLILLSTPSTTGKEGSMFRISEGLLIELKKEDADKLTKFTASKLFASVLTIGIEGSSLGKAACSIGEFENEEAAKDLYGDTVGLAKAVGTMEDGSIVYALLEEKSGDAPDTDDPDNKDTGQENAKRISLEEVEDLVDRLKSVLSKSVPDSKMDDEEGDEITEEELREVLASAEQTVKDLISNEGRLD